MLNYIIIFLISMVPLVELRGALIYSQAIGMPLLASYIICVIGNMLPVPIIYLFARKVLIWGKDKKHIGKFFTFCIEKGEKGGKKLQETAGKGLFVALFLFVGIPLRFSIPGVADLRIITLPTSSTNDSNPKPFPKSIRNLVIFSICPDGRGIWVSE